MQYTRVTTHLLTIDPNFQRDIQVGLGVSTFPPIFCSVARWIRVIATLPPEKGGKNGFRFAENHVEKKHGKLA